MRLSASAPVLVWSSVKRELSVLLGLAPLLSVPISSVILPTSVAVDASLSGAGVVALDTSAPALAPLAALVSARLDVPAAPPSFDTTPSHHDHHSAVGTVSSLHLLPSVSALLQSPSRVVASFPWATQEHINSLELRATLAGLRKLCSAPSSQSSRGVVFTDSAVAFFALRKGRSSSHTLLRRVRPISALLLASGMRVCPVWLPSALNPADAPSRVWSLSAKQRNRLAHSYNGNTSAPLFHFLSPSGGLSPLLPSTFLPSSQHLSLVCPSNSVLSAPLPPELRIKDNQIVLPPLRKSSVASSTFKNYMNQLSYFLAWLSANNLKPSSPREIDHAFESFLQSFFSARDGRGLALARNAMFGLCLVFPHLRQCLHDSRRSIKGWEKLCPSSSHPPLSWNLASLLASHLLASTSDLRLGLALSVGLLLAWEAYLRVGELCGLLVGDVMFHDVGSVFKTSIPSRFTKTLATAPKRLKVFSTAPVLVSLLLRNTKTGPNQWAQVRSPVVARLLHSFLEIRSALGFASHPSTPLFPFSAASFRVELDGTCLHCLWSVSRIHASLFAPWARHVRL